MTLTSHLGYSNGAGCNGKAESLAGIDSREKGKRIIVCMLVWRGAEQ